MTIDSSVNNRDDSTEARPAGSYRFSVRAARALFDLLCPPRCPLCGVFPGPAETPIDPGVFLCQECQSRMPPLPRARCRFCGQPFMTALPSEHVCALCLEKKPPFDRALAAGLYDDCLRDAIRLLKYRSRTELTGPLAAFMAEHLEPPFFPPGADLVLPVPLHARRLKQRAFNQALILARALYRKWPEKIRHDILTRRNWTRPQVGLSETERTRNVRGAFEVPAREDVKGRSVILVDDVYTSGATARECARVLKRAGAKEVLVATLARVG